MFNKKEPTLEKFKEEKTNQAINGVGCSILSEPIPNYNSAACEIVYEGKNNSYIVLGRDRPSDILSGYGGSGASKCGSIDLVAGRTSAVVKEFDENGKVLTDPSIPFDAARILIVQKTDVDNNFYLPDGKVGNRKGKSAAIIKADNIRVIAREGIKLVCNIDRYDSNGELKVQKFGVDLIATDAKKIQPIPKGKNLEEVISDIYDKLGQAGSTSAVIMSLLLTLLAALAAHTHPTGFGPSGPSVELIPTIAQLSSQLGMQATEAQMLQVLLSQIKATYLNPGSEKYINSLHHNLD